MDHRQRRRRLANEYRRVMADERATETAEEREERLASARDMLRAHNLGQLLLLLAIAVLAGPALATSLDRVTALRVGIVIVVALGASGQVLQGLGEHFSKLPSDSLLGRLAKRSPLKAYGYYCAAVAYTATASIALANGVPSLLVHKSMQ